MLLSKRIRTPAKRILRAAICTMLLLGQTIGAFGMSATASAKSNSRSSCTARPCGCTLANQDSRCCCELPAPAPIKSCCKLTPKKSCCEEQVEVKPAKKVNRWLTEMMAQRCRGDAPPSAIVGDPEIAPRILVDIHLLQVSAERLIPTSDHLRLPPCDPPIPPPRLR